MAEEDEASRCWREVVAAVDYLADAHRAGLTVWDALEEAIRWWTAEWTSPGSNSMDKVPWNDPEPLRTSLDHLLSAVGPLSVPDGHGLPDVLTAALRVWITMMADRFNESRAFVPVLGSVVSSLPSLRGGAINH